MEKLNFMGIGPRIGGVAIPWLAVTIYLTVKYHQMFDYVEGGSRVLFFIGLAAVIAGCCMYLLTAVALLRGLKETKLVRHGTFYLCCNPLYASVILFLIPGISLMMNSWLILTTSLVAFVIFKLSIRSEYAEMEKFFGDDYREYRSVTPEFFPFPMKKWF